MSDEKQRKRDPVEEAFQIVLDPRVNRSMKQFLRRLVREAVIRGMAHPIIADDSEEVAANRIAKELVP